MTSQEEQFISPHLCFYIHKCIYNLQVDSPNLDWFQVIETCTRIIVVFSVKITNLLWNREKKSKMQGNALNLWGEDISIRNQCDYSNHSVAKLGCQHERWLKKMILCSLCIGLQGSLHCQQHICLSWSWTAISGTFCAHRDERVSYCHGQSDHNSNNCDLKVGR